MSRLQQKLRSSEPNLPESKKNAEKLKELKIGIRGRDSQIMVLQSTIDNSAEGKSKTEEEIKQLQQQMESLVFAIIEDMFGDEQKNSDDSSGDSKETSRKAKALI